MKKSFNLNVNGNVFEITQNGHAEISFKRNNYTYIVFECEVERGSSTNAEIDKHIKAHLSEYKIALEKLKKLKPFL